ncbi:hypothetical protein [Cupriavidus sp. UYPR2.512]|nr:hypothetical protein [Cupriavidus sp. UYPR2.512]
MKTQLDTTNPFDVALWYLARLSGAIGGDLSIMWKMRKMKQLL